MSLCHEDVLGSGAWLHAFLTSALDGGEWSVSGPQGKIPWYPLDRKLGGPQSRSGRCGEEKNSQPLTGPELPIIQLVAQRYTTELSQLQLQETSRKMT
jgi:hypothetical protein